MRRSILLSAFTAGIAMPLAWTILAPVVDARAELPSIPSGLSAAVPERLYPFRKHHGFRGYNRPFAPSRTVRIDRGALEPGLSAALPERLYPFRNGFRAVPFGGIYGAGQLNAPAFGNNVAPSIVNTNRAFAIGGGGGTTMLPSPAPAMSAAPVQNTDPFGGGLSLSVVEDGSSAREDLVDYGEIGNDVTSVRIRHWKLRGSSNHAQTFDRTAERGGSLSRTSARILAGREARRMNRASGSLIEAVSPQMKELAEERDYIRELKGKDRNPHITYLGYDD